MADGDPAAPSTLPLAVTSSTRAVSCRKVHTRAGRIPDKHRGCLDTDTNTKKYSVQVELEGKYHKESIASYCESVSREKMRSKHFRLVPSVSPTLVIYIERGSPLEAPTKISTNRVRFTEPTWLTPPMLPYCSLLTIATRYS